VSEELFRRYARTTRPEAEGVERVLAEVTARRSRPAARAAVPAGLLALAAAILLAVATWPGAGPERRFALDPGASTLREGVSVEVDGEGTARVHGERVAVAWAVGTLAVEVEPGRSLDVRVETDEAKARVVGTGFTVARDALGTQVVVRHGRVAVGCVGTDEAGGIGEVVLEAGSERRCVPTTAAGLLGRAQALERAGAAAAEVRAAADAGVALATIANVRGELLAVRLRSFLTESDADDALAAATAYLDGGYPERRADVLAVGIQLAVGAGDCARADAWAREAGAEGCPSSP